MMMHEKPNIDATNCIDRNIGACRVRLFFAVQPNVRAQQMVLDSLLLVFDKRMQEAALNQQL